VRISSGDYVFEEKATSNHQAAILEILLKAVSGIKMHQLFIG